MPRENSDDNNQAPKPFWQSLTEAHLPRIAIIALGITATYATLVIVLAWRSKWSFSNLGQFGDSFGALTSLFNALAFAGLIATVVLQSRELHLTRQEMTKQAAAQEKLALATADQVKLTQEIEAIRLRPFIKAEWERVDKHHVQFWMRNVGRGVAIVRSIELRARKTSKQFYGSIRTHNVQVSRDQWRECIAEILSEQFQHDVLQFNDLNRALAPDETQALVKVWFQISPNGDDRLDKLRGRFRPEIIFESVTGQTFSTLTQVKLNCQDANADSESEEPSTV